MNYFTDEDQQNYLLSDCNWWDEPVWKRPDWMRNDCSGRMTSTENGVECEEHFNAFRNHKSSTHSEYVTDGYSVTIQHCEKPGCDKYLGVNYPSEFCEDHR